MKKPRKYVRTEKWYKAHKYIKGVTLKDEGTKATGNHDWSVRVVTPGSDEDLVDRAERAEDSARMMGHKYECLRLLILEALGRK